MAVQGHVASNSCWKPPLDGRHQVAATKKAMLPHPAAPANRHCNGLKVRRTAARTLGSPDSYTSHIHAGDVALGLHDPDWSVRRTAVEALGVRDAEAHAGDVALLLQDSDWTVRRAAAASLARLGSHADAQAKYGLVDRDPKVREVAAAAMRRSGADGAAHAAELLSDVDWNVRREAASVLGLMGQDAIAHAHEIAALLRDVESSVQCAGIRALVALGVASRYVDPLTALLRDRTAAVRIAAAEALGKAGQEGEGAEVPRSSCAAVASLFHDSDEHVRAAAAVALGQLGPAGAAEAAGFLKERDWRKRVAAADALAGGPGISEVDAAAAAVYDTNEEVREAAARALSFMGPSGAQYAAGMLEDSRWEIRNVALRTLGSMVAGADYVDQVAKCLKETNGVVRRTAALALGCMGEKGAAAAAQLLTDDDMDACWAAFEAISAAGPKAAAEAVKVVPLLDNQHAHFRRLAAECLGVIGEAAAPYAEDVAKLLTDRDCKVRRAAASALAGFGTEALAAHVESLLKLLSDQDESVRLSAIAALDKAGDAVPAEGLVPTLRDPHPDLRKAAAKAIGAKGEVGAAAVSELLVAGSAIGRASAAMTMGFVGEVAQPHVEALLRLLNDVDINVKVAALGAIGMIGQSVLGGLGEDVEAPVRILCSDQDGRVKCAAFEALHKVKTAPQPEEVKDPEEEEVEQDTGGAAASPE